MQQSNKLLPIQLVSSKNNYMNEVMLPKQKFYFYDTTAAQNPQKYIFESSNHTVDRHNEYKTASVMKDFLCPTAMAKFYTLIILLYYSVIFIYI